MNIGIPEIIMLMIHAVCWGIALVKHGEPEEGKHNIFNSMIGSAIALGLMYWGGFFS